MLKKLYLTIYTMPLSHTLMLLIGGVFLWRLLDSKCGEKRRLWRRVSAVLFLFWAAGVLSVTLFFRQAGAAEVHLLPFRQLFVLLNGGNPEIIRMLWMNVMLFLPGGLFLGGILQGRAFAGKKYILTAFLFGVFSIGVEVMQVRWGLGTAETDDVLCNLTGGVLGFYLNERIKLPKKSIY